MSADGNLLGSKKCQSCPHPREDKVHVLRCPHPAQTEWRQTFLISICKTCDKLHTRPNLQVILLTATEAWFNDTPGDFSQCPPLYSNLIHQQMQIGWRQLFNGQISTEWLRFQDKHLHEQGLRNKTNSGLLWATNILSSIWDERNLIWTIHNEVIQPWP
jgi:hypothetical protein